VIRSESRWAYTVDSQWRNRTESLTGRVEIVQFLKRKWFRELDYRLIKELWACMENRIAVRFVCEFRDDVGNWFRLYGSENWEFDEQGLVLARHANVNDQPIMPGERKLHWRVGRRPDGHPGLRSLGL
jgi:uncharacterized protein